MNLASLRHRFTGAALGLVAAAGVLSHNFSAKADTVIEINPAAGEITIQLDNAALRPDSRAQEAEGPALYLTDEARRLLGDALVDRILAWANEANPGKKVDVYVALPDSFWEAMPPEFQKKVEGHLGLKRAIDRSSARVHGMPVTFPLPPRPGDEKAYCIIQMPKIGSRIGYSRIFAIDRAGQIERRIGTEAQERALVAAHESTHCGHKINGGLAEELEADEQAMKKMIRDWPKLFPMDSVADSENLLRSFMGARALAIFQGEANKHGTFVGLDLPGRSYSQSQGRPPQETDAEKIKASILAMEQKVLERHNRNLKYRVPMHIRFSHVKEPLRDYTVLYKTIKELHAEGAFNDDPLQKRMAEGYLEWVAYFSPSLVRELEMQDSAALAAPPQRSGSFDVASPNNAPH